MEVFDPESLVEEDTHYNCWCEETQQLGFWVPYSLQLQSEAWIVKEFCILISAIPRRLPLLFALFILPQLLKPTHRVVDVKLRRVVEALLIFDTAIFLLIEIKPVLYCLTFVAQTKMGHFEPPAES